MNPYAHMPGVIAAVAAIVFTAALAWAVRAIIHIGKAVGP